MGADEYGGKKKDLQAVGVSMRMGMCGRVGLQMWRQMTVKKTKTK